MEELNIGIIIAQLINFSILLFIFKYFLGDKLVKAIEDRKEKLRKISQIDSELKEKIEKSTIEAEKIINDALDKSKKIISESEEIAKQKKKDLLNKAELEAESIIKNGKAEVEKEKLSMLNGVKAHLTGLILKFNKKLFGEEKLNKAFVEKELSSIK